MGTGGNGVAIERWQEFEDEELVVAALLGDVAAFDVLVLRYRPAVLAAVSRQISRRGLGEGIFPGAFLLAFKALPPVADPPPFPPRPPQNAPPAAIPDSPRQARPS